MSSVCARFSLHLFHRVGLMLIVCGLLFPAVSSGTEQVPPPNYDEVKAFIQYLFDADRDVKISPKRERRDNKLMYTTGGIKSRAIPAFQEDEFWGAVFNTAATIEVTRADLNRDFWRNWIERAEARMQEVVSAKATMKVNSDEALTRLTSSRQQILDEYQAALDGKAREEGLQGAEEIRVYRRTFCSLTFAYFKPSPTVHSLTFWASGSRKYHDFQQRRGNPVNEGWETMSINEANQLFQLAFTERVILDFRAVDEVGNVLECRNVAIPQATVYVLPLVPTK